MRHAVLQPFYSSQHYNFGNNEAEMPNLDVPTDTNFCLEPRADGNSILPSQQYQSDFQTTSSNYCETHTHQSIMLNNNFLNLEKSEFAAAPEKKRSIDMIENVTGFDEPKKNKKRKVTNSQCYHQVKEYKVPVRRSQKLSDKITTLQKLVSPYGKTDTTSVLEEAFLSIKILEQQIQKLFQKSYNPCHLQSQESDDHDRVVDLHSRGLCLFPLKKLYQQYCFDAPPNIVYSTN